MTGKLMGYYYNYQTNGSITAKQVLSGLVANKQLKKKTASFHRWN